MYSAARVNQFGIKDTCFEFVINISRQGNKFADIAVLIFCEVNDTTPGFYLVLSRHIHNPVKQII